MIHNIMKWLLQWYGLAMFLNEHCSTNCSVICSMSYIEFIYLFIYKDKLSYASLATSIFSIKDIATTFFKSLC